MQKQSYLFSLILVSIFGLISCKSETSSQSEPLENQGSQETTPPGSVEVKNMDQTYQKIQETKSLRIDSEIVLDFNNVNSFEKIVVDSRCKTSFIQDELSRSATYNFQPKIPSIQLLPIEILSPSQGKRRDILCDIHMDLMIGEKVRARVQLSQVQITHTMEYSNLDPGFLRTNKMNVFKRSELISRGPLPNFETGEATLFCENSKFSGFSTLPDLTWDDIIHESLFIYNNTELCRLVIGRSAGKPLQVTPAFYIQGKESRLKITTTLLATENNSAAYNRAEIATLTIKNTGSFKSQFKLSGPTKGTVMVSPVYYNSERSSHYRATDMSFTGTWMIENPKTGRIAKVNSKHTYEVGSGEALFVHLVINAQWDCPLDIENGYAICGGRPLFSGIQYLIPNPPTIIESLYEKSESNFWKSHKMTIAGTQPTSGAQAYWSKSQYPTSSCKMIKKVQDQTATYYWFKNKINPTFCQ